MGSRAPKNTRAAKRSVREQTKRSHPSVDATKALGDLNDALSSIKVIRAAVLALEGPEAEFLEIGHVSVAFEKACSDLASAYNEVDKALGAMGGK